MLKAHVDNLVNFRAIPIYVFATQPNYFSTAESKYMQEYVIYFDEEETHWANSLGLRHENSRNTEYGEVLYTARGSQGITTFGWIDDTFAVWPLLDQPHRL